MFVKFVLQAVTTLRKAEEVAKNTSLLHENVTLNVIDLDDNCEQAFATIASLDAYTEYCAHVIFGPVCDFCLGK